MPSFIKAVAFFFVLNIINVHCSLNTPIIATTTSSTSSSLTSDPITITTVLSVSRRGSTTDPGTCSLVAISTPIAGVTCNQQGYKPMESPTRTLSSVSNKFICLFACLFTNDCESIGYNDSAKTCDLFDIALGQSSHLINAGSSYESLDTECFTQSCPGSSSSSSSSTLSSSSSSTLSSSSSSTLSSSSSSTLSSSSSSTLSTATTTSTASMSSLSPTYGHPSLNSTTSIVSAPALSTTSKPYSNFTYSASTYSPPTTVSSSSPEVASSLGYTVSTVYATSVYTITKCPTTVTDCPLNSVTTETISMYTTMCPIQASGGPAVQTEYPVAHNGGSGNGYGSGSGSDLGLGSSGSGSSAPGAVSLVTYVTPVSVGPISTSKVTASISPIIKATGNALIQNSGAGDRISPSAGVVVALCVVLLGTIDFLHSFS